MITGNYYCVRAGVGFSDINKRAEYTITYDLKTEQAALASFVKEHEIGFTIRHFDEISEKLSQITEEQYNRYLKNLEKLAKETEEGAYIKKAFKEAVSFFQK